MHLDEEKRKEWKKRFGDVGIDKDANINNKDEFSLEDLRIKYYSIHEELGVRINEIISDLKRCVAVINSSKIIFIVKDYDSQEDTITLSFLTFKDFRDLMTSIHVGVYIDLNDGKQKPVNTFMIYNKGKNKNHLLTTGIKFYDERENMFSYFVSYDYQKLNEVDENLISDFLNHTKEVIANNNIELYEYILNWYAYILQNLNGKTGTALVIIGKEGCGKTVVTNAFCKLLGVYANKYLNHIENLTGKFNTA